MTDEELLSYFFIHSRTERALFAKEMVARLMAMGGSPPLDLDQGPNFIAVHAEEADILIALARKKMNRPKLQVIKGGAT